MFDKRIRHWLVVITIHYSYNLLIYTLCDHDKEIGYHFSLNFESMFENELLNINLIYGYNLGMRLVLFILTIP